MQTNANFPGEHLHKRFGYQVNVLLRRKQDYYAFGQSFLQISLDPRKPGFSGIRAKFVYLFKKDHTGLF